MTFVSIGNVYLKKSDSSGQVKYDSLVFVAKLTLTLAYCNTATERDAVFLEELALSKKTLME